MRTWPCVFGLVLLAGIAGGAEPASRFQKVTLDPLFRSEGVAVADFNHDGRLDVATGNLLYLGPDWKTQPMLAEPKEFDPKGYSNQFLCFAEDIDHDGWLDLIVVGFPGAETAWLKNPGAGGGAWARFAAVAATGNESPLWLDVDGDGHRELLFTATQGVAVASPGGDPTAPWPVRVIAAANDPKPGHGIGCGDVNGDGRPDVLCPDGWWEGRGALGAEPWPFHPATLSQSCAQMAVLDVDGDGDADILSSSAHNYGVWWTEQTPEGWLLHEIDKSVSQTHALHLADVNGDGLMDFVTGKRFWAHTQGDPGIDEPALLCWFELQRPAAGPVWTRHVIDDNSGVGLHAQVVDANLDGRPDVAISNKKGVYLFVQSP